MGYQRVVGLVVSGCALVFGLAGVTSVAAAGSPVVAHVPRPSALSAALAPDGTVVARTGSFDARGYTMSTGADGTPVFHRAAAARRPAVVAANPWSESYGVVGADGGGQIFAVAVSGSRIYVGGSFSKISTAAGLPMNNIAMWDGHGWHSLGRGTANGTSSTVRALAVSGSSVYAGGDFLAAGGHSAAYVAVWSGGRWSPLGAGVSNPNPSADGTPAVHALAVSGTTLYAAGSFRVAGTTAAESIASWNGTSWSALGGGLVYCNYFTAHDVCAGTHSIASVQALAVSGSTVYAGGGFNYAGGSKELWGLAGWNGTAWSGVGGVGVTYVNGAGSVLAMSASGGTLYVAGSFDHVGGTWTSSYPSNPTGSVAATSVASFNGTTWAALGTGPDPAPGGGVPIIDAVTHTNGHTYIAGNFTGAGGDGSAGIAQFDGTTWRRLGAGLDSAPNALVPMSTKAVIAVGLFSTSGAIVLNGIGKWTGSAWTGLGLGMSGGSVSALAASGANVWAAGIFGVAGSAKVNGLAHFNGTRWDAMGGGVSGGQARPIALAVDGNDIYLAGGFSQVGSVPANNIAMWDGTHWHALSRGTDGLVRALVVYNGLVYAGGEFAHAGTRAASDVAVWDPATGTWRALGGNAQYSAGDSGVNTLAGLTDPAQPGNDHWLAIGGAFTALSDGAGNSATFNNVAAFDTSAAITGPLSGYFTLGAGATAGVGGDNSVVYALSFLNSGALYVGGDFNTAGTLSVPGLAVSSFLNPGGWTAPVDLAGGSLGYPVVHGVLPVGATMYVAGDFDDAGGRVTPGVVSYDPGTATVSALGTGLVQTGPSEGAVGIALAQGSAGLYIGGQFSLAGGIASQDIGLWTATAGA